MAQYLSELLANSKADQIAVVNLTEQLMFPLVPIDALRPAPGHRYIIKARGKISNVITTPGTVTFRLRWGGLTGPVIAASAAIAQNAAAQVDKLFSMEIEMIWRSIARANSSALAMGRIILGNNDGTATGAAPQLIPPQSPAPVTGLDTWSPGSLAMTAQFSITGNSLQVLHHSVKAEYQDDSGAL